MATLPHTSIEPRGVKLDWGITDERIRAKVGELVDAYRPLRVVAFGSWARGEAGPDSDLDLAVILDDRRESKKPVIEGKSQSSIPMSVDVIVERKARHCRLAWALASVHYDIAHEGIVLYDGEGSEAPERFYPAPTEEELRLSKTESLEDLLRLAAGDEQVLNIQGIPLQIAAFHGQQAIEKLLKIRLALADVKPPRVHDLEKLLAKLEDNGLSMPLLPADLKEVTKYATVWRYYVIPEAETLDLAPLRQTVVILREHVVALMKQV